jgi:hypothetical protein
MTSDTSLRPISPLRARMIEDMTVRGFNEHTRRDYVRHVRSFAAFIGRSPDTATAEELRLFQLHQTQSGMATCRAGRWWSPAPARPPMRAAAAGYRRRGLRPDRRRSGDGLLVISRNTAFTYQGKRVDTKQIGRELAVRYVLEGSVRRSGSQPPAAPRLSIVVLPFTNLSDDREQQYFADGITEDLTTDLSRLVRLVRFE